MPKINQAARMRRFARGKGRQMQPTGQTFRTATPGPALKPYKKPGSS